MTDFQKVVEGLKILVKYEGADIAARHEIVFAGVDAELVSGEDTARLEELGFFVEEGSWATFVN